MSSRRTTCRLPSASISSTVVLVSEASRPLITRPSVVATVYWTKLPSTLRLGSRMWISSSSRGSGGHAGEVGADLAAFAAVAVALGALLLEDHLAGGGVAPLLEQRAVSWSMTFWRSGSGRPPPCRSSFLARRGDRLVRGGRPGPASGRAPARRAGPGSSRGRRPRPGSSRRGRAGPGSPATARAGASAGSRSTSAAPTPGALLGGDGVDQAGGQLGRRRGA